MTSQIPNIILPRVLVALLVALCSGGLSSAQTSGVFQNFQYTATATEVTITRYPTYFGGSVSVPFIIDGKPVTTIGAGAFENCQGLSSITLPTSIKTLGMFAFRGCRSLSSFTIPSGVTSIQGNVFEYCSNLSSISVSTYNSQYSSLDGILYNKSRTSLISIPESRSGAVVLPSTLTSIGSGSTNNCGRITSVSIPASVTYIGSTFPGCRLLAAITVDPANPILSSREGVLYNKGFTTLMRVPGGKTGRVVVEEGTGISIGAFGGAASVEEVVLPASTTSIPSDFFSGCESLKTFVIPNGCTSIGDRAFSGCSSIEEINVPDSVESIGYRAFTDCSSLLRVRLPQGITAIGGWFLGCGFTEFTIPGTVERIEDSAFSHCLNLTGIVFPESVKHIEARAFFISGLRSVRIPATVQTIGIIAFSACPNLTEIQVDPKNANYTSLDGVLYSKDMKTLIQCPAGKSGVVTVPESVTAILQNAFSHCTKITAIRFMGNSPTWGGSLTNPEILYFEGRTGFGAATWNGFTATNVGQPTPVGLWLVSHGLPYDHDLQDSATGVPMLLAYALGIDPDTENAVSLVPVAKISGDTISLTYFAGRPDLQYIPQHSSDLVDWKTGDIVISAADANGFRKASCPRSGGAKFMRLKVMQSAAP